MGRSASHAKANPVCSWQVPSIRSNWVKRALPQHIYPYAILHRRTKKSLLSFVGCAYLAGFRASAQSGTLTASLELLIWTANSTNPACGAEALANWTTKLYFLVERPLFRLNLHSLLADVRYQRRRWVSLEALSPSRCEMNVPAGGAELYYWLVRVELFKHMSYPGR